MKQVSFRIPTDIRYFCTELGCYGSMIPRILALLISAEVFWLFVQVSLRHSFWFMTILKIFFGMLLVALQCHLVFPLKEHVISLSSSSCHWVWAVQACSLFRDVVTPHLFLLFVICFLPAEVYCTLTWECVYPSFMLNVVSIYVLSTVMLFKLCTFNSFLIS